VQAIGKKQAASQGFARNNVNQGFLYYSPIIQSVPEDVRVQAQRMVSGKLILAARIDAGHGSPAGDKGLMFHEELEKKLEKLSEPPDLKDVKALAAPDDPVKKRRGGKKVRKAKERTAITELQKLRNRMEFGKEEKEVSYGDDTEGMGMVGSSSSVRAPTIDKRTRARLPKAKTKGGQLTGPAALLSNLNNGPTLVGQSRLGSLASNVSGMQSSLSFSSVQGIELPSLNVDALRKAQSDSKWFKSGTFTQINQK
jgi:U4/U6 small nuclear ribonucleoprotein PRP31